MLNRIVTFGTAYRQLRLTQLRDIDHTADENMKEHDVECESI